MDNSFLNYIFKLHKKNLAAFDKTQPISHQAHQI